MLSTREVAAAEVRRRWGLPTPKVVLRGLQLPNAVHPEQVGGSLVCHFLGWWGHSPPRRCHRQSIAGQGEHAVEEQVSQLTRGGGEGSVEGAKGMCQQASPLIRLPTATHW